MLKINEELKKYNLIPYKYTNKNNIIIVDTKDGSYVLKKRSNNNIFAYLDSRNFKYYPTIISDYQDDYLITKYIDGVDIPKEQQLDDMIDLVSLLHNKTTHYKQVDEDEFNEIYENINNNIDYLYSYYNDVLSICESKIYWSPAEYLLLLNAHKIYYSLSRCKYLIDKWKEEIKDIHKKRLVILHNNLKLEHFIENDVPYLISWDMSKIDSPIFDIYKLYRNHRDIDYSLVLNRYEKKYPLKKEEKLLLFALLSMPDKIEFDDNIYQMCIKIQSDMDLLDKLDNLISPYDFENAKNDQEPKNKY